MVLDFANSYEPRRSSVSSQPLTEVFFLAGGEGGFFSPTRWTLSGKGQLRKRSSERESTPPLSLPLGGVDTPPFWNSGIYRVLKKTWTRKIVPSKIKGKNSYWNRNFGEPVCNKDVFHCPNPNIANIVCGVHTARSALSKQVSFYPCQKLDCTPIQGNISSFRALHRKRNSGVQISQYFIF